MTDERGVIFTVRNHSGRTCHVLGYPDVQLITGDGARLPFSYAHGGGPYVTKVAPHPIRLAAGGAAYLLIAKAGCALANRPDENPARWIATRAIIRLPGQHATRTARAAYPAGAYAIGYCTRPRDAAADLVAISPIERHLTELIGR